MPVHAIAGHVVIIVAPLAAVAALLYAWWPQTRAKLRLPLVLLNLVAFGLGCWASIAGSQLFKTLREQGGVLPVTKTHANLGDALTVALLVLAIAVLALVWWLLAPGRPATVATKVAAVVLTLCAVAVCWLCVTTLSDAMASVWDHHELWNAR